MADQPNRPWELGDPRSRYYRDATFKAMVDMFRAHIRAANYTPSELREAVMLAVIIETERNPMGIEWEPKRGGDRG